MQHPAPLLTSRPPVRHWHGYLLLLFAALVILVGVYRETAWSLVALWQRSETYAHGFMIYPVSLYLIWRGRNAGSRTSATSAWRVAAVTAVAA